MFYMKEFITLCLLFSFSLFANAQSTEDVCRMVNTHCNSIYSAYYEADVCVDSENEHKVLRHSVSFNKNRPKDEVFAKFNAQIYENDILIEQKLSDNKQFTYVDFYENIAEQYEKEDYEDFLKEIDTNLIPEFVFNKSVFDLKAIKKGDIQIFNQGDTIFNGVKCLVLKEVPFSFDEKKYVKLHFIRTKDYLPIAKFTEIDDKHYSVILSRIDENAAFHNERFEFDKRNTAVQLKYKSFTALDREWKEQEKKQSSFAYGSDALNFKIKDIFNNDFELQSHKGKVIIMVFFYNNCSPCVPMLDDLQNLYNKYKEKGVEIVAMNPIDKYDEDIFSFVKEHELSYTISQIPRNTIEEMYLVRYFPTIFIVDKKGRVCYSHQGYNTLFQEKISKIIDSKL